MIKRIIFFASALLFCKGIAAMTVSPVQVLKKENAEILIKNVPTILVLDIGAQWCGPCKKMAPHFEEAAQQLKNKYLFAKLDLEDCPESIIKEYEIGPVPVLLVLQQGKLLGKSVGFKDTEQIKKYIEEVLQGPKDYSKLSKEQLKEQLQTQLMTGSPETIKAILAAGLNANEPLPNGLPPLAFLLMAGVTMGEEFNTKVEILLDAGASAAFTIEQQPTNVDELTSQFIGMWERSITRYRNVQKRVKERTQPSAPVKLLKTSAAKL